MEKVKEVKEMAKKTKKFGGKNFTLSRGYSSKSDAQNHKNKLKRLGAFVRIIKEGRKFNVYKRWRL